MNEDPETGTYIYLGVPRVGVEVVKLTFAGATPVLSYLGRIQTPGNASDLHIEYYDGAQGFPQALLFVADYDGRFRIYKHPF